MAELKSLKAKAAAFVEKLPPGMDFVDLGEFALIPVTENKTLQASASSPSESEPPLLSWKMCTLEDIHKWIIQRFEQDPTSIVGAQPIPKKLGADPSTLLRHLAYVKIGDRQFQFEDFERSPDDLLGLLGGKVYRNALPAVMSEKIKAMHTLRYIYNNYKDYKLTAAASRLGVDRHILEGYLASCQKVERNERA